MCGFVEGQVNWPMILLVQISSCLGLRVKVNISAGTRWRVELIASAGCQCQENA